MPETLKLESCSVTCNQVFGAFSHIMKSSDVAGQSRNPLKCRYAKVVLINAGIAQPL